MRWPERLLVLVGLAGCPGTDPVWVDFNDPNQSMTVEVTDEGSPLGDPLTLDLVSNVGQVPVGTATLDPGSGPVGTEHFLLVEVFDDFEDQVGRASVVIDSEAISDLDGDGQDEARTQPEYDLERDSADPGVFAITLQSQGEPGEVRTDVFTIHVWTQDLDAEQ